MLKQSIRKAFNTIGFDLVRMSKSPRHSLLGLRHLPIRTIIDVGGNTGQFARMISSIFPEAHIYSFEPLGKPFKQLKEWAKADRIGKITCYNLGLGDSEDILEMFNHIEHSPSSSFLKTTQLCESFYPFTQKHVSVPVKLTTLDKWAKRLASPLKPEILIKLDVQGYEDRVIRGGQETFDIAKACILEVNIVNLYERQATFKDITTLLYELDFCYAGNLNQRYADDGHVIYIDAVFVKSKSISL